MQSTVSMSSTFAPRSELRDRVANGALLGAVLAAFATMIWWRSEFAMQRMDTSAISLHMTVAVVVVLCAAACAALEFHYRWLAVLCTLPVVLAIAATIIAWVFGLSPPFGVTLFAEEGVVPSWFPPHAA